MTSETRLLWENPSGWGVWFPERRLYRKLSMEWFVTTLWAIAQMLCLRILMEADLWSRGFWEVAMSLLSFSTESWYPGRFVCQVLDSKSQFYSTCISFHKIKGRWYFWCVILLQALFFMILKLPYNYLKLQVLFYILKRFADNLEGRYSFIVKKFLPTFTCTAVPRTWNLDSGDCAKSGSWETLKWRFASRSFTGECFGDQDLWRVREDWAEGEGEL